MGDSRKKEKGFFKFFSHETSSQSLKIPSAFIEYKNGELPKKASLRDKYGNLWPIGLAKKGRDFCFQEGWEKFIEENNVEFGDFFIFDYDDNGVFDFKLLGKTGCEKRGTGCLKSAVKEEEEKDEEMNDVQRSEEPKSMNLASDTDTSSGDSGNDEDEEYIVEEDEDEEEEEYEEEEEADEQTEEEEKEEKETEENEKTTIWEKKSPHSKAKCKRVTTIKKKDLFDKYEEAEEDIEEDEDTEEEEESKRAFIFKKISPHSKAKCKRTTAIKKKPIPDVYEEPKEETEQGEQQNERRVTVKGKALHSKAKRKRANAIKEKDFPDQYEEAEEEEFKEAKEMEESEEEEEANESLLKKKSPHSKARRKRTKEDLPDHYGADIFKSGLATQPKNPYFVARIRAKRRDQLYIPVDVVRDYNLELPSRMIIRDSAGREFATRVKNWKDGRIWLLGGWRSLCRWNLVEKDDRCICEFVKGKGQIGHIYMQVEVLHDGAVSNPIQKK